MSNGTNVDDYIVSADVTGVTEETDITLTATGGKRFVVWGAKVESGSSKTLSSISVQTSPAKTTYYEGDDFDPTGLVITRNYIEGEPDTYSYAEHSSDFTFTPSTNLEGGTTSITISYGGKTTTQAITTHALSGLEITTAPTKTTYDAGETFDPTGMVVTATYDNSTTRDVTANCSISPSKITNLTRDITVSYRGQTAIQPLTVNKVLLVTFDATSDGGTSPLNKNGITLTCSNGALNNGSEYRLYKNSTTTISSNIGEIESIEFVGTAENPASGFSDQDGWSTSEYNGRWEGAAESVSFTASGAQVRATQIIVTLVTNDPLVTLAPTSASSINVMKGDIDTSVKVLVKNIADPEWSFTFDEDEVDGKENSSYVNVSASELSGNVATLTVTPKNIGSSVLHLSVSGTDCVAAIPITVNPRPASMSVKLDDDVVTSIEIQNNSSSKQFTFEGLDTDSNPYSITAEDVDVEVQSGGDFVNVDGDTVSAVNAGEAVLRYSLKQLPSVYTDVTVSVLDDYNDSVNSVTFNNGLADRQGEHINVAEVFKTKVANTHFGSTAIIANEELRFSYIENDFENALSSDEFIYDFVHGSEVDATHRLQTIWVYVAFDEDYSSSFTITVEQVNTPLTALAITNAINNEIDVMRGDSVQLAVSYTPSNTTDSRDLTYSVISGDAGHTITVSSTGLVSAGSGVGKKAVVRVSSVAKPSIYVDVTINNVLEEMTITVAGEANYNLVSDLSTLKAGDTIVITNSDSSVGMKAYSTGNNCRTTSTTSENNKLTSIGEAAEILLSDAGDGKFYMYDGANYLYAAGSGSNNYLKGTTENGRTDAYKWTLSSSEANAKIVASSSNRNNLKYNSNSSLFSCYASNDSSQGVVEVYKKDSKKTVEADLIQAIETFYSADNFVCDGSGDTFDAASWNDNGAFTAELISKYNLAKVSANEDGNEVEQFLAKYDYVIGVKKALGLPGWIDAEDFLGRFETGGIHAGSNIANPVYIESPTNNEAVALASGISIIGLVSIGGLFFARHKRKED